MSANPTTTTTYSYVATVTAYVLPAYEKARQGVNSSIQAYPLVGRVFVNWKVTMMDASTVITTACVFITFIKGATFVCGALVIVTISCAISSAYLRYYSDLKEIGDQAKTFQEENTLLKGEREKIKEEREEWKKEREKFTHELEGFKELKADIIKGGDAVKERADQLLQKYKEIATAEKEHASIRAKSAAEGAKLEATRKGFEDLQVQMKKTFEQWEKTEKESQERWEQTMDRQMESFGNNNTTLSTHLGTMRKMLTSVSSSAALSSRSSTSAGKTAADLVIDING